MPLYLIQDSDRPLYIIAKDKNEAENLWKEQIAKENDMQPFEVEECDGINKIADNDEILIPKKLWRASFLSA